jgi:hypothetical protein
MVRFAGSGDRDTAGLKSLCQITPEQAAFLAKEFRESAPKNAPLLGRLGSKVSEIVLSIHASLE